MSLFHSLTIPKLWLLLPMPTIMQNIQSELTICSIVILTSYVELFIDTLMVPYISLHIYWLKGCWFIAKAKARRNNNPPTPTPTSSSPRIYPGDLSGASIIGIEWEVGDFSLPWGKESFSPPKKKQILGVGPGGGC